MDNRRRNSGLGCERRGGADLALGTAQLGLAYGPRADNGVMPASRAAAVLSAAAACGVTCLDTASAYGVAEERIGSWCRDQDSWPRVVTKLPALADGHDPAGFINDSLARSLRGLRRARVEGYLVHRARDLTVPGVAPCLRALVEEGRIGAFGVSVYTPEEVESALSVDGLSLLQAPVSLVNQTMIESGALARAADAGCLIFARSVLVQGLMLCPVAALPPHWLGAKPVLAGLHGLAKEAGCSLLAIALAAVSRREEVFSLVVGCDDPGQVRDLAAAMSVDVPEDVTNQALAVARGLPPEVTDPRRWRS